MLMALQSKTEINNNGLNFKIHPLKIENHTRKGNICLTYSEVLSLGHSKSTPKTYTEGTMCQALSESPSHVNPAQTPPPF